MMFGPQIFDVESNPQDRRDNETGKEPPSSSATTANDSMSGRLTPIPLGLGDGGLLEGQGRPHLNTSPEEPQPHRHHRLGLQTRQAYHPQPMTSSKTIVADNDDDGGYTDVDVIVEKGGRANMHMGNRVYLRLVQRNKEQYRRLLRRRDKDMLVRSILLAIQQNGGRFRQFDSKSNRWSTVAMERAYQKVRQALREPDRTVHKAAAAANAACAEKPGDDERKPAACAKSAATRVSEKRRAILTEALRTSVASPIRRATDEHDTATRRRHQQQPERPIPSRNQHRHETTREPSFMADVAAVQERGSQEANLSVSSMVRRLVIPPPPPPPAFLGRTETGGQSVPPPPVEALLDREDSMELSHLMDIVGQSRRSEEASSDSPFTDLGGRFFLD